MSTYDSRVAGSWLTLLLIKTCYKLFLVSIIIIISSTSSSCFCCIFLRLSCCFVAWRVWLKTNWLIKWSSVVVISTAALGSIKTFALNFCKACKVALQSGPLPPGFISVCGRSPRCCSFTAETRQLVMEFLFWGWSEEEDVATGLFNTTDHLPMSASSSAFPPSVQAELSLMYSLLFLSILVTKEMQIYTMYFYFGQFPDVCTCGRSGSGCLKNMPVVALPWFWVYGT